jgi:hypothetical protein
MLIWLSLAVIGLSSRGMAACASPSARRLARRRRPSPEAVLEQIVRALVGLGVGPRDVELDVQRQQVQVRLAEIGDGPNRAMRRILGAFASLV